MGPDPGPRAGGSQRHENESFAQASSRLGSWRVGDKSTGCEAHRRGAVDTLRAGPAELFPGQGDGSWVLAGLEELGCEWESGLESPLFWVWSGPGEACSLEDTKLPVTGRAGSELEAPGRSGQSTKCPLP